MKCSKNGQKFAMSKTLQICYLRHAEHHAKNRTSLCSLDHDTLFMNDPLLIPLTIDSVHVKLRLRAFNFSEPPIPPSPPIHVDIYHPTSAFQVKRLG